MLVNSNSVPRLVAAASCKVCKWPGKEREREREKELRELKLKLEVKAWGIVVLRQSMILWYGRIE